MLKQVDTAACTNRWRNHSKAVAVYCGGLMLCALLVPPCPGALLVATVAMLSALAGARVQTRAYLRALSLPFGFLATSAAGLCISLNWANGWHVAYSPAGMHTALRAGLRALAAISVTLLFAFTVSVPQWLALLRRLHVPEALLDLILLTYRTIFLLDDGRLSILRAQRNRLGYRTWTSSLRSGSMAASALFVRALTHSQRLERGLAARNYEGRLIVLLPLSATRKRHLALALALPALLGVSAWLCEQTHLFQWLH